MQLCVQNSTAVFLWNIGCECDMRMHRFANFPTPQGFRCEHLSINLSSSSTMHLWIHLERQLMQLRSQPSINMCVESSRVRSESLRLRLSKTRNVSVWNGCCERHLRLHSFPKLSLSVCFQLNHLRMSVCSNPTMRLWLQIQHSELQLSTRPCCHLPITFAILQHSNMSMRMPATTTVLLWNSPTSIDLRPRSKTCWSE